VRPMTLPRVTGRVVVGAVAVVVTVVIGVLAVMTDRHADGPAVSAPRVVDLAQLRPHPGDAKGDRPAFYDDGSGCQVGDGDSVPVLCASGDESAERTIMLVGDSKIAQWQTAYSDLGRAAGWRVVTVTKSACPFADVHVTSGEKARPDCRAWGRAALREVLAAKPDVVVTSQRADSATLESGGDRTRGAMVRGLRAYWSQLVDAGIQVVVQLDNPFPTTHPVYRCVADHPRDLGRCAFDADRGIAESSAPVLREAAGSVPGVSVVDMTSSICPGEERCPAVIDDVLVYRAGSHLTRTFTVSVERQLATALHRATDGEFDATGR
jgi:hypothetical protein